jgi:hypothetical protein
MEGRHGLGELDQFFGAGVCARWVDERTGDPERSVAHGVPDDGAHRVERRGIRGTFFLAHRVRAYRCSTEVAADVDRVAVGFH